MRKQKTHYQILEVKFGGRRELICGGKSKEIALDALRMMSEYNHYNVDWYEPFQPHNMTDTAIVQGVIRKS